MATHSSLSRSTARRLAVSRLQPPHMRRPTQTFNVLGTFAAGSHTATVNFLNDAYGRHPPPIATST